MARVAGHALDKIVRKICEDSTLDVCEDDMWKLLGCSKDSFMEKYQNAPTKKSVEGEEQLPPDQQKLLCCKLLNRLSEHVRNRQGMRSNHCVAVLYD